MLIATPVAAALNAAPVKAVVAAPWGLARSPGAADRTGTCLPHPYAAKAAPRHKVTSRIVCPHDKAREAAGQRAEAARKANEA